jgi:hypothetical protein
MKSKYAVASLSLICGGAVHEAPAQAQKPVQQNCNNNTTGPRKSIQCTFMQPQLGVVWKGSAGNARKLYYSKPRGDTGQDRIRWWFNGNFAGEQIVNPGDRGHIFKKKRNSTVVAKVEVETLRLPTSGGPSTIYVHFETLDLPVMPDLSSCSNTATADRQSVCWTGRF